MCKWDTLDIESFLVQNIYMQGHCFFRKTFNTKHWIEFNKTKAASQAVPSMFDIVYTANAHNPLNLLRIVNFNKF